MVVYVPGFSSELAAHKTAVEAAIADGGVLTGPTQATTKGDDIFLLATLLKPDAAPEPMPQAMRRTRKRK